MSLPISVADSSVNFGRTIYLARYPGYFDGRIFLENREPTRVVICPDDRDLASSYLLPTYLTTHHNSPTESPTITINTILIALYKTTNMILIGYRRRLTRKESKRFKGNKELLDWQVLCSINNPKCLHIIKSYVTCIKNYRYPKLGY